ncbi:Ig-like domain-containing protein, partial [Roseovarius sp. SYSU LYC5161]|uniref:Ig-like domain-containing protein n=1 Tax=Roseovarius halophilus (ex Wu et al. 2025) TaxID=3376060 RepID=UPI00399A8692
MTLTADNGYQLVLEHSASGKFNNDGRVEMNAPSNVTFKALGFEVSQINFENIDDMDDAAPRDTWIANVPGKWEDNTNLAVATNSDGLEIFTLDAGVPVSWDEDERQRLRAVDGVGDILINTSGGNNPRGEAAIFRPNPSVKEFKIYMDDIDGSRGATMFFTIAGVSVEVQDTTPPELTGPSGIGDQNVTNGPLYKTVTDGHTGEVFTVSANEPIKTFSLLGDDAEHFQISDQGQIEFKQTPQFDNPHDLDGDNIYITEVEAVDLAGNTTTLPITITVTEDGTVTTNNAAPVISAPNSVSDDPFAYSVPEYEALAVEQFKADEPVTWSISGTDASNFSIDSAGTLSFNSLPSHANPNDSDEDSVYNLEVEATDVDGDVTTEPVVVNVTPKTPQLTGPDGPDKMKTGSTFQQEFYEENYIVDDGVIVEDNSGKYNPKNQFVPDTGENYAGKITSDVPITSWSVHGGDDQSKFRISAEGLVFFDHDEDTTDDPADYENPNDANQDNIYNVKFKGEAENGEIVYADFSVKIKDLIEGVLPGSEVQDPTANDDFENDLAIGDTAVVDVLDNDIPKPLDNASVRLLDNSGAEVTTLTVSGEGDWSVDTNSGEITFTPESDFEADPTPIQYVVSDDLGRQADPATVTLEYNTRPITKDDTSAGNTSGQAVELDVLANDTSGSTLDASTVQLVQADGTQLDAGDELDVSGEGTWSVGTSSGAITFTPESDFEADPTPIRYVVSDTNGSKSNPAKVTVGYGSNPVAADDTSTANPIGLPVVVDVLNNDAAGTGNLDPSSVELIDGSSEVTTLSIDGEGVWSVESDGKIKFTPEDGFSGDPTPVDYVVSDTSDPAAQSNQAKLTIEYTDPPVAEDDEKLDQPAGTSVTFDVLDNDTVSAGRLVDRSSVKLLKADGGKVDTITVPGEGSWTVNEKTGGVTFTPELGFTGDPQPIAYIFGDNQGNVSAPASISLGYGEGPIAENDTFTDQPSGQAVVVDVVANDTSGTTPDDSKIQLVQENGSLLAVGDSLTVAGEGTWSVGPNPGEITFTPESDFEADPTPIQYLVSDSNDNRSNLATVSVGFAAPPIAKDDTSAGNTSGHAVAVDVLANDASGSTPDASTVQLMDDGTEVSTFTVSGEGVWSVESDGKIKFEPLDGLTGDPTPIRYLVSDANGSKSNLATVTVGYGSNPVAADDTSTANPIGSPVLVDILNNDAAGTGNLDPSSVELIDGNSEVTTLSIDGEGVWSVESDGKIKFTPGDGFSGDPTPVDYVVSDGAAQSNQAELTIEYTDPPVAADDEKLDQPAGTSVTFDVLDNDTVVDRAMDVSTVVLLDESNAGAEVSRLTIPDEGVWTVDTQTGLITFSPVDNFLGPVTPVPYVVSDTQGNDSDPADIVLGYQTANQYRDSDGDGIPDHLDLNPAEYDPQGYFYCEDDGRIIPGGSISVTGPSGTNSSVGIFNNIRMVKDGSDGEFQWFALEEGTFTVNYTAPAGFDINTGENEGTLDVTNLLPENPAFIGSEEDGDSGVMKDFSPSANAYYDEFIIAAGDPHVLGNNIALKDCAITHVIESVQDGAENNSGDPSPVKFKVSVENAPNADQAISYTLSGSAEAGVDFTDQNSGVVILGAGETSVEIILDVLEDGLVEGAEGVTVSLTSFEEAGTTTPLDSSLTAASTIRDDDATEIVVRDLDLSATEVGNDHGSMAFSLAGEPSDDVILTFSGDEQCDVSPKVVTLTPQNYSAEQTVDIIAIEDGKDEGNHDCQPAVSVSSADNRYNGLGVALSTVQIVDSMIDQIYEPLKEILENDLRETVTKQSRLFEDIAKGAQDRLANKLGGECEDMLNRAVADRPILFATGSHDVLENRSPVLSEIIRVLQRCEPDRIEVLGFTDASGNNMQNNDLSQARAESIVEVLARRGVDSERLVARGYGEREPVADNATAEGRAQNRRVEFRVISEAPKPEECGQVRPFDVNGSAEAGAGRFNTDGTF